MQNRILPPKTPKTKRSSAKTPFQIKLKKRCRAVGIHFQKDLAVKMGTSQATVSRWFAGSSIPDMNQAVLLAGILGCTVEWLCNDVASPAKPPRLRRELTQDEKNLGWIVRQIGGAGVAFQRLLKTVSERETDDSIAEILVPALN